MVTLLIILSLCYFVFIGIMLAGWRRYERRCEQSRGEGHSAAGLTIVASHRDEPESVVAQWEAMMSAQEPQVAYLSGNDGLWRVGKKRALKRLMEHATTPYCLLTDIDITVHDRWAACCSGEVGDRDLLLLPVRMSVAEGYDLLDRMWQSVQSLEFASLVGSGIALAELGHPIMCNGAGMVVDRQKWLECYADLRPDLPSGDDMFLLHAFKKKGYNIAYAAGRDCVVTTAPCPTLDSLWRQRMRWASKAPAYTDVDTLVVGGYVAASNVLALCLLCEPQLYIDYWLIKSVADALFLSRLSMLYGGRKTMFYTLIINFFYPFYIVISGLAGLMASIRQRRQS